MPTLNLFTNIPVDAVVASDILRDATKVVAKIIGKPESVTPTSTQPCLLLTTNCLMKLLSKLQNFYATHVLKMKTISAPCHQHSLFFFRLNNCSIILVFTFF